MGVVSRQIGAWARAALFLAALGGPVLGAPARAAPTVYAADAMKKVRPADAPLSAREAHLFAAKNEFESFQAVVVGPATGVSASMSALTGPSTLRSAALFREALIYLANPSAPDGATGWFPDALVPDVDDVVGEKRNAFPFNVPSGESRAIWVELFVPADAPAGDYHGALTVRSDQGEVQLPVTLTVWNFGLPSTATLRTHFGLSYPTLPSGHGVSGVEFTRLRGRYSQLGLDHRISLGNFDDGDFSISHVESAYGAYIEGTAPTRLKGAKLTTVQLVGTALSDWVARFKARGWFERLFKYTCDEPPSSWSCQWSDIQPRNAANKAADPRLRTLVTTSIWSADQNGATSFIDIFAPPINYLWDKPGQPHAGIQASAYAGFLAQNPIRELWVYQSCMSHGCGGTSDYFTGWPSYVIDAASPRARAEEWLSFQLGVTGELYWETTWAYDRDPWSNQWDFTGNGDGTLFYPGTPAKIGGSTHIPVASIRLKMIREGMEDFEYLRRVSSLGDAAFARQVANALFPNAYATAVAPSDLMAARAKLAQRILELEGGEAPPAAQACSDGTAAEGCSAQKPLLCRAGALAPACATCGCPASESCRADGSCAPATPVASVYTAPALQAAPALDGALSEYESAPSLVVGGARVQAAWDAQALYLAFDVSDDRLVAAPAGGEGALWDGDGVEVMIAAPSSARGASAGPSDYHLIVGVDGRISSARAWSDLTAVTGASAAVDRLGASLDLAIASGYRVELEVPWTGLGIAPSEGLSLGFDVAVNDKSDPSGSTSALDWRGLASFNNPAAWGSLVLGGAGAASAPDAGALPDAGPPAADAAAPAQAPDAGATSGPDTGGSGAAVDHWLPGCSSGGGPVLAAAFLFLGLLIPRRAGRRGRRDEPG